LSARRRSTTRCWIGTRNCSGSCTAISCSTGAAKSYYQGYLSCRPAIIEYIYSAQDKTGIALSPAQREVLEAFMGHAARPDLRLAMDLRPGDIQLLNNSVVLHSRTAYRDHPQPHKKRHLLRLWLNVEKGRPVDHCAFPYRNGVPVGEARSAAHNV